ATVLTPGLDVAGTFGETGIPAAVLTRYLAEHGIVVEKTGLYSFFILFTIGITKGRWNTLISQLQRFKDAYDADLPVPQAMPRFAAAYLGYDGTGLRELCQGIHDFYRAHDLARPTFYERLRRIERILGTDLDSAESRTSLHVALLALEAAR
ncbi:MAG TPA: helix-turn-helix domain-containing protein, partial [Streptosporangiaceae bacterium]|nr:helix-turn-helix domain-containing protein [Streptosporangiaceae bacterium]